MFVSRWIVRPFVLLAVGWAALGIAPLTPLQAASQTAKSGATSVPPSPSPQRAVLDRYCIGCHNQTRRSAGLALDDVDLTDVSAGAVVWEKVIRKLRAGAMPPPGSPRPDRATYDTLASWLENELDRTAQARPNPGRTETFHRLNRTEYHNVIRDLLALDVDVASLVPDDDGSYGFDNIAGVLKISPTLLDRYLTAARAIASTALGSSDVVPSAETLRVRSDFSQRSRDDGLPIGTRGGALFQHTFPLDAEYEFRIDVGGAAAPERHQLEVTIDGTLVNTFAVGRGPSSAQGAAPTPSRNGGLKFRVPVTAGPHEIAATFVMKTSATPDGLYKPSLRSEGAGLPTVDGLTVTGPYGAARTTETPSRRQIFVCHPTRATEESECATKILSSLARRAYRRPVAKSDVDPLLRFYESGRVDGDFEAGIESALRRLLVSPQFLFRVERDPSDGQQVYGLSDLELASRLSFFLWSSIPDDELLDTAARGRLKNRVGEQFCRAVVVPAQPANGHARCGDVSVFRRESQTRLSEGDGAVLRKSAARESERDRTVDCRLYVRHRTTREALWHTKRIR